MVKWRTGKQALDKLDPVRISWRMTIYEEEIVYCLHLFGKEMFTLPNKMGSFLHTKGMAIKIITDFKVESISLGPYINE